MVKPLVARAAEACALGKAARKGLSFDACRSKWIKAHSKKSSKRRSKRRK